MDTDSQNVGRPSGLRIVLAFALFILLLYLFGTSWWRFVWMTDWYYSSKLPYMRDPNFHGTIPLTAFQSVKYWFTAAFSYAFVFVTAGRFVYVIFRSQRLWVTLPRAFVSAFFMMKTPEAFTGFGNNTWSPYIDLYFTGVGLDFHFLPDFALLPVIAALFLGLLGCLGVSEFWGLPLKRYIPERHRRAYSNFLDSLPALLAGDDAPKASAATRNSGRSGRKPLHPRWGSTAGFAASITFYTLRTLVMVYLIPLFVGLIVLAIASFVIYRFLQSNAAVLPPQGLEQLILFAFSLVPFVYACKKSRRTGTRAILVLTALAVPSCFLISYSMGNSQGYASLTWVMSVVLITSGAVVLNCSDICREFFGPENDDRFFGVAVDHRHVFRMYAVMCRRMLRPYGILIALFVVAAVPGFFSPNWYVASWPMAAMVTYKIFRNMAWYEAAPFHYRYVDPNSTTVSDFVES